MLIYYDADIDPRRFEGRTTIAVKIKQFLEKKGYKFTKDIKEAELLHVHSSGIFPSYNAYKLKEKYNIPCIYSLYSTSKTEPIKHIRNWIVQRKYFEKTATNWLLSYSAVLPLKLRALFLKKLDKVIVPSNYIKNRLYKNTRVIRFGVDVTKFKPLKRKDSSIIKVAFFGHPGVFKGVNDYVKASKSFSDNIEPYVFLTKKTKKIEKYIKNINPKIKLFGFVPDVVKAYNNMDIIVLPYRTSLGTIANPLVLLEAMACGKAIITTNLDFVKEIVKDSAVKVKAYSPIRIAKAVNKLAKNKVLCKNLGEKARDIAVKYYDEKLMLNEYLRVYKEFGK
jgi:glycosyltransferase involved in cell wall biosynthesis